ncbi:unnamed protein product, partial [Meganyctiphanes norvegica]
GDRTASRKILLLSSAEPSPEVIAPAGAGPAVVGAIRNILLFIGRLAQEVTQIRFDRLIGRRRRRSIRTPLEASRSRSRSSSKPTFGSRPKPVISPAVIPRSVQFPRVGFRDISE